MKTVTKQIEVVDKYVIEGKVDTWQTERLYPRGVFTGEKNTIVGRDTEGNVFTFNASREFMQELMPLAGKYPTIKMEVTICQ